jgi:replicative DNA helicase
MDEVRFIQAEQQVVLGVLNGLPTTLNPSDLQSVSHQVLFRVAQELQLEGITPDIVTMNHKLTKDGRMEEAGGLSYLTDLYADPVPKEIEAYENIVREESIKVKVISLARSILDDAEAGASAIDLLVRAQTEPLSIMSKQMDTISTAEEVGYKVLEEIAAKKSGTLTTGIPTPLKFLNEILQGLQPGDLIIVAGRPAMGKTALGGQLATYTAKHTGPVFIGSLEMDESSLVQRMLSAEAKVNSLRIREGKMLMPGEMESIQEAVDTLGEWHPIFISDQPRQSASELRAAMARQYAKSGLKLAVIDYLGLLKEDRPGQSRYKEVGDSVKILRATARELKIPVVLLCQLNRGVEARENKRPLLSDLKESGEIEQDSDVVIMLYREEYYCEECQKGEQSRCTENHNDTAEILIRKQRKGPIGNDKVVWIAEYTMFRDMVEGGSPSWEGHDGGGNTPPTQEPEKIEDSQLGLGYKPPGSETLKDFPNPVEEKIPF